MKLFSNDRAQALFDKFGLDVVLTTSRHNSGYLADYYYHYFERGGDFAEFPYFQVVLLPAGDIDDACILGGPDMEIGEQAVKECWIKSFIPCAYDNARLVELVCRTLKERGLGSARIGVELPFINYVFFSELRKRLPDATFKGCTEMLNWLRAVKCPEEIERMRDATRAVRNAMQAVNAAAGVGVTTLELERVCLEALGRFGAEREIVSINEARSVWCEKGGFDCPGSYRLKAGDVLRQDIVAYRCGYLSDLAAMAFLGDGPPEVLVELMEFCREANDRAAAVLKPGLMTRDYYEIRRRWIIDAGFRDSSEHEDGPGITEPVVGVLDHGIGRVLYEPPHIGQFGRSKPSHALEPGMIVNLEIAGLIPGIGMFGVEEPLVITKDGAERLVPSDPGLKIIAA